jgi:hypothetical protein
MLSNTLSQFHNIVKYKYTNTQKPVLTHTQTLSLFHTFSHSHTHTHTHTLYLYLSNSYTQIFTENIEVQTLQTLLATSRIDPQIFFHHNSDPWLISFRTSHKSSQSDNPLETRSCDGRTKCGQ